MVSQMANYDALFHALADGTRRAMVERLARGPASVSDLAAPHDSALPTVLKHLRVLESSGLVVSRKEGRVRLCRLVPERTKEAEAWLARQHRAWAERLDRLDAHLEGNTQTPNTKDTR